MFKEAKFPIYFFTKLFKCSTCEQFNLKELCEWGSVVHERNLVNHIKEYKYYKFAIAMWPKRFRFDLRVTMNAKPVFESLYSFIVDQNAPVDARVELAVRKLVYQLRNETNLDTELQNNADCEQSSQMTMRFITLLEKCNKPYLTGLFLEKVMFRLNTDFIVRLGKFISHFGIEALRHSLKAFMKPSVESLSRNCVIIQVNTFFCIQSYTSEFRKYLIFNTNSCPYIYLVSINKSHITVVS